MIGNNVQNVRTSIKRSKTPFTILVVEDNPTDIELMLHTLGAGRLEAVGWRL